MKISLEWIESTPTHPTHEWVTVANETGITWTVVDWHVTTAQLHWQEYVLSQNGIVIGFYLTLDEAQSAATRAANAKIKD